MDGTARLPNLRWSRRRRGATTRPDEEVDEPRRGGCDTEPDEQEGQSRALERCGDLLANRDAAGGVRSIPEALRSNTQASNAVTGNPIARATTTGFNVQSDKPSACMIGSTTCSTANETIPQLTSARKTRRRLNSETKSLRSAKAPP